MTGTVRDCHAEPSVRTRAALHMSAATAKTHVGRLLAKLKARDRTQLVIAAYEAQLVDR